MSVLKITFRDEQVLRELSEELEGAWSYFCSMDLALAAVFLSIAISTPPNRYSAQWWLLSARIFILLITQVRFFIGHRGYLKSLQNPEWVPIDTTMSEAARIRRGWDYGLMLLLTASKAMMAVFVNSSNGFVNSFLCLMLCDLLWFKFEPRVRQLPFVAKDPFLPRSWMWFNVATAVLILFGSHAARLSATNICLGVTVWHLLVAGSNCLLDFYSICRSSQLQTNAPPLG
jgi:hypothetical protein